MSDGWAVGALERIAAGQTPCVDCGRVHERREGPPMRKWSDMPSLTWADPVDGHPYRKMGVQAFARSVLAARLQPEETP